ncbi:hypothetical protein GOODEAATRI_007884 [Goodea atripinnis]|uniref:Uncharacterized protein n=1 Tax=Goodea atripinnis TaxID=208336 RepID=A0ABV0P2J9_9TELE
MSPAPVVNSTVVLFWKATVGVDGEEQGTQHTTLWRGSAEADGRRLVSTQSNPLAVARQ